MTNIGKPYEGKPHVRFDEEELGSAQLFTLANIGITADTPGPGVSQHRYIAIQGEKM